MYCGVNTLSSAKENSVSQARMSEGDVSKDVMYMLNQTISDRQKKEKLIFFDELQMEYNSHSQKCNP